ncbi:zinc-dependent alcohol dehydrogenase family protein [Sphingobium tyrosinilyticum]|uniref:NAD(P)-dependent alcohol dehydrogenase n=1 Tax=Sphingobium tyrosinilyticum TaxID=2715436 RepID=A0ABV9F1K7_9SPHN
MRLLQITGPGGINDLRFVEKPIPTPGEGEVVLRVTAASLNRRDLTMISSTSAPGTPQPPFTPMSDAAGVVHAVGPGVTCVKKDDRVTSLFFQKWMDGPINSEVRWATVPSMVHDGVAAEYVTLLAQGVHPVPVGLTDQEGATLPCAALTAWRAMFEDAGLQSGAKIVVQGTGGVSIFALQFGAAMGMEVVVTSSSDEKLERAKALGAAHTVNYRTHPDWGAEVKKAVGSAGVDFVLGVGGAGNLAQSLDAIGLGGHIAIVGMLGGAEEVLPFRALTGKNAKLQGVSVGNRAMFGRMAAAIEQHAIKPVIDKVYPFAEAIEAFRAMKAGDLFGKIVIDLESK